MSRIENALEKAAQLRSNEFRVRRLLRPAAAESERSPVRQRKVIPIDNPYLGAFHEPASAASEEYKKTKISDHQDDERDPQRKTILVTSAVARGQKHHRGEPMPYLSSKITTLGPAH